MRISEWVGLWYQLRGRVARLSLDLKLFWPINKYFEANHYLKRIIVISGQIGERKKREDRRIEISKIKP